MANFWKTLKSLLMKIMNNNIDYKIFSWQLFALNSLGLWFPKNALPLYRFRLRIVLIAVLFVQIFNQTTVAVYIFKNINAPDFQVLAVFFFFAENSGMYKTIAMIRKRELIRSTIETNFKDISLDYKEYMMQKQAIARIRFV